MLSFSALHRLHAELKDAVITAAAVGEPRHIFPEVATSLAHLGNVRVNNVNIFAADFRSEAAEVDKRHAANSWNQGGQCVQQQQHQPQQAQRRWRRHLKIYKGKLA